MQSALLERPSKPKSDSVAVVEQKLEFPALSGMRFVIACLILYLHFDGLFGIKTTDAVIANLGAMIVYFFMLSGFLLTYRYKHLNGVESKWNFYVARFARVVPIYLACLLLTVAINQPHIQELGYVIPSFIANLFLLQSWIPVPEIYFGYNSPSWSVSVDMFLYLTFPVLLVSFKKRIWTTVFCVSMITSVSTAITYLVDPSWIFTGVFPLTWMVIFVMGMVAFRVYESRVLQKTILNNPVTATIAEIISITGIVLALEAYRLYPLIDGFSWEFSLLLWGSFVIEISLFLLLIVSLATKKGLVGQLLSTNFASRLGDLSAGVYLCHLPIIMFFRYNAIDFSSFPDSVQIGGILLSVFSVSYLIMTLIEIPFRSALRNSLSYKSVFQNRKGSNQARQSFSELFGSSLMACLSQGAITLRNRRLAVYMNLAIVFLLVVTAFYCHLK